MIRLTWFPLEHHVTGVKKWRARGDMWGQRSAVRKEGYSYMNVEEMKRRGRELSHDAARKARPAASVWTDLPSEYASD